MSVTPESILEWCRIVLDVDGQRPQRSLAEYLAMIPRLKSLADVPSGTAGAGPRRRRCQAGAEVGEGDIRLRSMLDTLEFGRQHGWKQIIFGHIGRKPEETLQSSRPSGSANCWDCDVPLVDRLARRVDA